MRLNVPWPGSLDHLVRPLQHAGWNCKTDLFCHLQVDHKFKLRRLLHGKVGRFGAFEDFVHVVGAAAEQL